MTWGAEMMIVPTNFPGKTEGEWRFQKMLITRTLTVLTMLAIGGSMEVSWIQPFETSLHLSIAVRKETMHSVYAAYQHCSLMERQAGEGYCAVWKIKGITGSIYKYKYSSRQASTPGTDNNQSFDSSLNSAPSLSLDLPTVLCLHFPISIHAWPQYDPCKQLGPLE